MIIKDSTRFIEMVKEAKATTPEEKIALLEKFLAQYSFEEWSKLENDPEKILNDVRETTEIFCDQIIARDLRTIRSGESGLRYSSIEDGSLVFDEEEIFEDARGLVDEHRIFFNHEKDYEIDEIIRKTVKANKSLRIIIVDDDKKLDQVRVSRPTSYLTPIAKVPNKLFEGVFNDGQERGVEIIKKSKSRKPIYTMVSIDFSALENVKINGKRELTPYDREVHDAICTLYYEGGNTFITINMIYQTMTGKENAHCSDKQARAISDSITKLMLTHVIIDASNEATIDKRVVRARYDSTMINAKRVTICINGQTAEAIKILDAPILLDYSLQKNQIGRFDIKLLDTPNNKNEETIILEGYLRRRILAIKGTSSLSPTILYETVYKQLDISASSDGALRKKKVKVRDSVKRALDYFKDEGFIKGYSEVDKGDKNRSVGVTIKY